MKKVILNKSAFDGRSNFERREKEVEVPELNALMGVGEGEVVIIKIRQIDLDAYLSTTGEIADMQRNIVEGIIEAANEKDLVKDKTIKALGKLSPVAKHRLKLVEKGLVSPKLKSSDILWISQMYPFVITKLANEIIELTEQGAVKKNS